MLTTNSTFSFWIHHSVSCCLSFTVCFFGFLKQIQAVYVWWCRLLIMFLLACGKLLLLLQGFFVFKIFFSFCFLKRFEKGEKMDEGESEGEKEIVNKWEKDRAEEKEGEKIWNYLCILGRYKGIVTLSKNSTLLLCVMGDIWYGIYVYDF